MDVYINRKEGQEALASLPAELDAEAVQRGIEAVHNVKAADVCPVVYCRDCMYAPAGDDDGNCLEWPCDDWPDRNPCPLKCEDNWHSHKPAPDFYCANGRRKRNE